MANGVIGKLSLDISDVKKNIDEVNDFLGKIGANIDLKDTLSKKISSALKGLIDEAKKAGEEVGKALEAGSKAGEGKLKDNKDLEEAVKLWREYYIVLRQAETAFQGGNSARAVELRTEAEAIRQRAEALKKEEEVEKQIAAVRRQYETAYSNTGNKDRLNQIKQEEQAQKELAKAVKDVQALKQKTDQQILKQNDKDEKDQLNHVIELYQKYYEYKTKAINAETSGNKAGADMFTGLSQNIQQQIYDLTQYNDTLKNTAESSEKVVSAQAAWQNAITANAAKESAAAMKENESNVKAYADALVSLYNEQSKLNNAVASGRVQEGSEEYAAATEKIQHFEEAVVRAGEKLDETGIKEANSMQNVQTAIDNLVQTQARMADTSNVSALEQVTTAYNNLKNAVTNYNIAKRSDNDAGMNYWQDQINNQMAVVKAIEDSVGALNVEAGVREQINQKIQEAKTLQDGATKGVVGQTTAAHDLENQLTSMATRMFSLMAVFRSVNSLVQNTVEYVTEFSDKMNEIQIITQKSNSEVEQLSQTYMKLAEQMNVSSLDMADAAIYFTRQGLAAEEIEQRLVNVTRYAKTANVEFKDASEIITSVVNSMGLVEQEMDDGRNATQRVADVFLAVGDNAATSGQEIGEAMQKAAASAGAFGMSMEWLSAYIATVSETTRQEARTIGTAFNTIIARLHQIKQNGYNSEDETKINDVQKALAKIDVALMDQNNEWRDMDTIFQEIGEAWGDLDGKTKSYIATTMAGVKQQNVFMALMNDLSKHVDDLDEGVEEGSRAWQLYNIAMNSAGTSQEKYAVWTDSVAASQERLNIAQEKFYSLLSANVIKGYNDILAGFVNMVTDGAKALNGWNIVIPVIVGGITALTIATKGFSTTLTAMAASHPVLMGIAAGAAVIGTLITALSALGSAIETQEERYENASKALDESNEKLAKYRSLNEQMSGMFESFGDETDVTSQQLSKYNGLLDALAAVSPRCADAVQQLRDGMMGQSEAAQQLGEELDHILEQENKLNLISMAQKYGNWSPNIADSGSMEVLQNWEKYRSYALESVQDFAKALRDVSLFGSNVGLLDTAHTDKSLYLTDSMKKYIEQAKKEYSYLADDQMWEQISRDIWSKYFYGEGVTSARDFYKDSINQMMEEALSGISYGQDEATMGVLREQLFNMLFGDDGIASTQEWANAGKQIQQFIANIINNGLKIDPSALVQYVGKDVFGEYFDILFGEQLDELKESGDFEEFAQELSAAYSEMLASGMTNTEIAELLGGMLLGDWDKAIDAAKNRIKDSIKEAFGEDFLGELREEMDLDTGKSEDVVDSLMWDDLDLSTLKTILSLVQQGNYTLEDFNQLMADANGDVEAFTDSVNNLAKENNLEETTEDSAKALAEYVKTIKSADSEIENIDKHIKTLKEGGKLSFDDILDLASAHPEIMSLINDTDALIARLKEIKKASQGGLEQTIRDMILNSPEAFLASPFASIMDENPEIDTLQKYMDSLEQGAPEIEQASEYLDQTAANMIDASKQIEEATDSWLKQAAEEAKQSSELEWQKQNGFAGELDNLQAPYTLSETEDFSWFEAASAALDRWEALDETMKKSISETYPELIQSLHEIEEAEKNVAEDGAEPLEEASKRLFDTLNRIERRNSAKYFKETNKAINDLAKGSTTAQKAFDVFDKELSKFNKAQQEVADAQEKISKQIDLEEDDFDNLSDVIGKSAEEIVKDFPSAVDALEEVRKAGEEAFDDLNREAILRITGVGDANFDALMAGMMAVESTANSTVQALQGLGMFTVEEREVTEAVDLPILSADGRSYSILHAEAGGHYQFLIPTSNNPLSSSTPSSGSGGKGGGGGGGGGGGKKEKTEVVKMLDDMGKVDDIQKWQQSYYQSQQKYYESTGQLQGVIAYMEREKEAIDDQTASLKDNIVKIEDWIAKKKAELAGLKESDEKYAEVQDDLEKLQKAHQDYTKQLVDNKTAIEELNQSIKEQHDRIRDMEIDLRETILKAIEDRESKTEDMLNAEIELENKIMDIIKRRYEKERDQIIETTNLKIEALQEERDLLEEQLRLRKEQADEEDKAKKLKELELQYQRISADPTRAKEAKKIQKEIADLREEMAWDAAEDEVKAQQESLEQQEQSLEDYIDYVHEYYEDLFEHPKLLIAEMEEIMSRTSDEILEWLKANDEEYAEFTAAQQEKTTKEWKAMLDEREGLIKTYWDEVEEIITKGDDYIIEFLKANSADYAAAGKLQAEKYTDEWIKKLDDLKKAHQAIEAEFANKYDAASSDGSGGGGGGGSGGGGGAKKPKYWTVTVDGKENKFDTEDAAKSFRLNAQSGYGATAGAGYSYITDADERKKKIDAYVNSKVGGVVAHYRSGGIADFTGPAWLDGTPSEPERILSPRQTELFETMVKALESMSRITIPTMPNFSDLDLTGSGSVSVGDIIVNVDNLDTDDDYEELAKKVSDILMERIGRTTVVGGLRINSF